MVYHLLGPIASGYFFRHGHLAATRLTAAGCRHEAMKRGDLYDLLKRRKTGFGVKVD